MRTMFCTANREGICVLQKCWHFYRKLKVQCDVKRSSMLCVFIHKIALCFVKHMYAFKSERNLMNGTELR